MEKLRKHKSSKLTLASYLGHTGGAPPLPWGEGTERRVEAEHVVAGVTPVTQ